jgi:hypothetical protein
MRPTCTASDSSWPGLSRPSTPFSRRFSKQGGDGRDKPGHDDVNGLQIPRVGMNRALILVGAAALSVGLMTAPEQAQAVCSVFDRHPCTPGFGSVFRHHPFTPYYCGVFSRPGCTPEIFYPLNQVPVLKVEGHVGPSEPADRDHPADRINELGLLLSKCLELPPDDEAQAGMRVTLKLAFKRDGELLADPRFTYTTHNAPDKVKAAYHDAALDMLKHCTPLPITDQLGGAIAGRPFVVAIKETRTLHSGDAGSAVAPGDPKP